MAEVNTHECDVCHAQKGVESNWWIVYLSAEKDSVLIQPWKYNPNDRNTVIAKIRDACGVECALKLAAQEMQYFQSGGPS